jgi:cytochrome b involved in lipid metabolism
VSSPYYIFSSRRYKDTVQYTSFLPRSPRTVFVQMREPSGKIVLTPKQVEALIENGHAIVILGQHVLNLDSWLNYHPGGAKVILHVVGRDATDEINA